MPWNSSVVVVLFFTSLTSTLCPLTDMKSFYHFKQQKKFQVSDNVQVLELPVSTTPDTHLPHTINPPQHSCILHKATQPSLTSSTLPKMFSACRCFGMAIPPKPCLSTVQCMINLFFLEYCTWTQTQYFSALIVCLDSPTNKYCYINQSNFCTDLSHSNPVFFHLHPFICFIPPLLLFHSCVPSE